MAKAFFLDRDGILNVDVGYAHKLTDFVVPEAVIYGLKRIQSLGFKLCIITNQSGLARGYFTKTEFLEFMNLMTSYYAKHDIYFRYLNYCPHHPKISGVCACRKPKPGMINQTLNAENVDPKYCVLFGDNYSDILAGERAGVGISILIGNESSKYFANSVDSAIDKYEDELKDLIKAAYEVGERNERSKK